MKRNLICVLLACMMAFLLFGCVAEPAQESAEPSPSAAIEATPAMEDEAGEQLAMAPGSYEAQAYGFYPGMPVTVKVTVSETAIENIEIVGDNMETLLMERAVKEKMIPRMIEAQSVYVDAITGATLTSAAVRTAATECLEQALVAGGSDAALVSEFKKAVEYDTAEVTTIDTDILVVGMGGSGISAALSAAENGGNVLAIDKAGKYGGTTCVTGEMLAVNPTQFCAENNDGNDYMDAEALYNDWVARTLGDAKSEMIKLLIDESGNTLDWLMYEHGWQFGMPRFGHVDYAVYLCNYGYMPDDTYGNKDVIAGYLDRLIEDYEACGGKYMLETEAYELIYDEASNTVTGVKAVGYDGSEYVINAKSVVLATGGFANNAELMDKYMVDTYYPLSGKWSIYGMTTNDGKMIEAALNIGAGTYNPSVPPICHLSGFPVNITGFENYTKDGEISFFTGRTPIWSEADLPTALSVAADSLVVDKEGNRFFNEETFPGLGVIKAGPNYYTIWSQGQFETFKTVGLDYEDLGPSMGYLGRQSTIPANTPLKDLDAVIEAGINTGYIYKADTIEELATQLGMDPQVLKATVDTYNSYCETGVDEMFGKSAQYLDAVEEGPFYAITGAAFIYTTSGALDVDTEFRVLKEDGVTVINGLYAIGTDSMGVILSEREQYVDYGGAAASYVFNSGRLVGKNLAEQFAQQ